MFPFKVLKHIYFPCKFELPPFWQELKSLPVERVKCAQLLPSGAQLLRTIAKETANVGAYIRNAKNVEFHGANHRQTNMLPMREIVPQPMTAIFTRSGKSRPII